MNEREIERFWSKVARGDDGECWEWTAAKSHGYGVFRIGLGRRGKLIRAHRISYEIHNGPMQTLPGHHGACVCHRCDNRACVNPAHLFLGTQGDNNRDAHQKGRGNILPPRRGRENANAKLDVAAVMEIRRLHGLGTPCAEVAKRFGIWPGTVSQIALRRTWRHVA